MICLTTFINTLSTLVTLCFTFLSFSVAFYSGVEVSPPFSHKATLKSVLQTPVGHSTFWKEPCVLYKVINLHQYGDHISNVIKEYLDKLREMPHVPKTSYQRDSLGFCGDANVRGEVQGTRSASVHSVPCYYRVHQLGLLHHSRHVRVRRHVTSNC